MSRNEAEFEAELQAKGLNAPRVTPAEVDAEIVSATYTVLPNGLTTVCQLVLRNGFSVEGTSACASPENFDKEAGEKAAYTNARDKIWAFLGFRLKDKLYPATLTPVQRLEIEAEDLIQRAEKLDHFLMRPNEDIVAIVGERQYELLLLQQAAMGQLLAILNEHLEVLHGAP